jgi:putative ABC transport system substrate-binding protein
MRRRDFQPQDRQGARGGPARQATRGSRRGDRTNRRDFITLLGGTAAAWPLAARAQQKLLTIGFMGGSRSNYSQWVADFAQRLRELGWVDGRTMAVEARWAEGRDERYDAIAAEFVRLKADVIVAMGTPATVAAKQATSAVPIVFVAVNDPVGTGLVASLPRPGGNITGLANQHSDLVGKRIELLREIVPNFHRLSVMGNVANPANLLEMDNVQTVARNLGLEVTSMQFRRAEDIALAFDASKGRADAVYVCADPLINSNRIRINTLAVAARLPTMHGFREYVEAGGLISYGPNVPDLMRRAGDLVDKILRGTKPRDIPVEQPTRFDIVINLTTAKTLGLTIPDSFLLRADEVIE